MEVEGRSVIKDALLQTDNDRYVTVTIDLHKVQDEHEEKEEAQGCDLLDIILWRPVMFCKKIVTFVLWDSWLLLLSYFPCLAPCFTNFGRLYDGNNENAKKFHEKDEDGEIIMAEQPGVYAKLCCSMYSVYTYQGIFKDDWPDLCLLNSTKSFLCGFSKDFVASMCIPCFFNPCLAFCWVPSEEPEPAVDRCCCCYMPSCSCSCDLRCCTLAEPTRTSWWNRSLPQNLTAIVQTVPILSSLIMCFVKIEVEAEKDELVKDSGRTSVELA